ncbi:hypothetical protein ACPOL_6266 [Acidisarcina polymorpha]|uniref:Uncharacterized protein n=1 Tax=Acidisarcina polymorpha TaxID=2211140 RepID=A0A2Z5G9J9_9BACT|nr:hypothetical protein ACPOL_6266 [Acidisarcina polymorpha]
MDPDGQVALNCLQRMSKRRWIFHFRRLYKPQLDGAIR